MGIDVTHGINFDTADSNTAQLNTLITNER
ncbi:MAG: CRISPR-associated DxTHG motif protein [Arsenophonus endosymbiont of Dermacentor nuttalli]